jgi:DNA-binding IclR family transcriptional regulator
MSDQLQSLNSVVGKISAIFSAVSASNGRISLRDLVEETGLPKSTASRVAKQLVATGALEECALGYRMGTRVFELGSVSTLGRLTQLAIPFLADVYQTTHQVVHLGVLAGTEVLYVEKVAGPRSHGIPSAVGGRVPAHCTALGKILLAFSDDNVVRAVETAGMVARTQRTVVLPHILRQQLTRFRSTGVAIERDEAVVGVSCLACPVLSRVGRPIAAISVTVPSQRFNPEVLGPVVRTTALALSRAAVAAGVTDPLIPLPGMSTASEAG